MGEKAFRDASFRTEAILKATPVSCAGEEDTVCVTARSHHTFARIENVGVFGGDGRMHLVPVPWTEYIPAACTRMIAVTKSNKDTEQENPAGWIFRHGLMAHMK